MQELSQGAALHNGGTNAIQALILPCLGQHGLLRVGGGCRAGGTSHTIRMLMCSEARAAHSHLFPRNFQQSLLLEQRAGCDALQPAVVSLDSAHAFWQHHSRATV